MCKQTLLSCGMHPECPSGNSCHFRSIPIRSAIIIIFLTFPTVNCPLRCSLGADLALQWKEPATGEKLLQIKKENKDHESRFGDHGPLMLIYDKLSVRRGIWAACTKLAVDTVILELSDLLTCWWNVASRILCYLLNKIRLLEYETQNQYEHSPSSACRLARSKKLPLFPGDCNTHHFLSIETPSK